jgi:hypothetical protein
MAAALSATAALAARFVKADAASRKLGIVVGNAVATALIAAVAALPEALTGPSAVPDPWMRQVVAAVLCFVAAPVFLLLATVGRLSAAKRDQRLAALRLLGLSPGRTLAVAMIENGLLALAGAVAGAGLFAGLAPAASAAARRATGWFAGTLTLGAGWLAVIALAVTAFSAVLAAAPARRLRTEPKALRGGGVRTKPGWWRLAPLAVGAGLLVWIGTGPSTLAYTARQWLTAGALAAMILGLALGVPVVSHRIAGVMARSRRTVPRLAGRGIQAEPSSGTRLVLGLGAVVMLAVAVSGVLWQLENDGAILTGQRVLEDGPQLVTLRPQGASQWGYSPGEIDPTIPLEAYRAVQRLPGVEAVMANWEIDPLSGYDDPSACDPSREYCSGPIIVGSCLDLLAILPAAVGCSDQEVRWLEPEPSAYSVYGSTDYERRPDADALTLRLWPDGEPVEFALSREVIRLPPVPRRDPGVRWRPDSGGVFIPLDLAVAGLGQPQMLDVVLRTPGLQAQRQLAAAVEPLGLTATGEDLRYYTEEAMLLTGFWALVALAVSVAVVNLVITAIDRAKERRPMVARQIALGVPGSILRRAQTLQVAAPLAGAIGLGALGGAAALVCYWLPDWRRGYVDFPWPQLGLAFGAALLGAALVVAVTMPLTRARLTPELLRRE